MKKCILFLLAAALPYTPVSSQEVESLPLEDQRLDLGLTPVLVVGNLEGPDWAQFEDLKDAAFSADGTLYLLDAGGPAVMAVTVEGTLRHMVGRRGEGPGEYRSPVSVDVLPDGTVAVFDAAKRAFLLYSEDGVHLNEVRPDFASGVPGAPMAVSSDGTLLALPERIVTDRLGEAMMTGEGFKPVGTHLPLLRVHLEEGRAATVVARLPVPSGLSSATSVIRAFVPTPSFGSLAQGRIALLASEDYRVQILTADGSTDRVFERGIQPRPTTPADQRAFRSQLEEDSKNRGRTIGQPGRPGSRARPPEPWFYPIVPPVHSISTDGTGGIWVLRYDPQDATVQGPLDMLSMDGKYRGTVDAGHRGLPVAFGPGGLVAFLEIGDLDVPLVSVYRLPEELVS